MDKKAISRSVFLIFVLIINYHCQGNSNPKQEKSVSENLIETKFNMKENKNTVPSGYINIDSVSFDGKKALLEYVEQFKEYRNSTAGGYFNGVDYTDETIRYIFPLVSDELKKQGYRRPSEAEFNSKMDEIFNLSTTSPCFTNNKFKPEYFQYSMYLDGADLSDSPFWLIRDGSLIFVPQYQFIFRVLPMPYHEIVTVENDSYYLSIAPNIYHYNKFFFNDSQASLTWLINNDIEFLELLVREFGYDKNERINKVVLRYIFRNFKMFDGIPNYSQFNDVFFKKDCQGKLSIRKGLLKTLEDETNSENLMYIYGLINYFFDFWEYSKEKAKYSEKEISEIFVNIAVVEERMRNAYYKPATPEWNNRSDAYYVSIEYPKLFEIAENNNYFDIPFDAVLEMVQVDGEPM